MLKLYIHGYLNRIQSSRRLEREAQRNLELMWLLGRLTPDFKTIANFRKDNPKGILGVCRQFALLCLEPGPFAEAVVAIDGSKFKTVNNRDRDFTSAKLQRRMQEIEASIERYLVEMDSADWQEPAVAATSPCRSCSQHVRRSPQVPSSTISRLRCAFCCPISITILTSDDRSS